MPRRADSPFLGRYALTPAAYKSTKQDMRRLARASQALLEKGTDQISKRVLENYLKEVQRTAERVLGQLREDAKQIK
jgi:hypothetical protein